MNSEEVSLFLFLTVSLFAFLYLFFVYRENGFPFSLYVSIELSSRTVSRKVFSPLQSLTSVFGMGTGGPSAFVTLTLFKNTRSLNIEQHSISFRIPVNRLSFLFKLYNAVV